jgi:ubiquinone biosynthesis protein
MGILTRASQVTRTVKNVGRMREVVSKMTRFGFGEFVQRTGLQRFSNQDSLPEQEARSAPVRLRLLIESLGPTFIKIGQVLAGRPDLVPQDFVREFLKLQDKVAPVDFLLLRPTIEEELGRKIGDCFSSFDTEPLATASIAQVHAARTLDGEDVVVKILKPEVSKLLTQDLEILDLLAGLAERVEEVRPFRPKDLVEEFRKTLLSEVNFQIEATNLKRYRANVANSTFLVVPRHYPELSATRVLTLERLRGVKLADIEGVRNLGLDPREILKQGMEAFYQSIMVDGFFHGDPHGGNLMVLPDGRLGLLDFGSVGSLSPRAKDAVVNMFLSLIAEDFDGLVFEYLNISPSTATGARASSRVEKIQSEVGAVLGPYYGIPLKDLPVGKILLDSTGIAFRNGVSLPRDLVLLFRSIMTLEGLGRQLDPDFDILAAAERYARVVLLDRYAPKRLVKEALFLSREWSRFAHTAPRQILEVLRQMENGDFRLRIDTRGMDRSIDAQRVAASKISLSVLGIGLVSCSIAISHLKPFHYSLELGIWGVSTSVLVIALWKALRK